MRVFHEVGGEVILFYVKTSMDQICQIKRSLAIDKTEVEATHG